MMEFCYDDKHYAIEKLEWDISFLGIASEKLRDDYDVMTKCIDRWGCSYLYLASERLLKDEKFLEFIAEPWQEHLDRWDGHIKASDYRDDKMEDFFCDDTTTGDERELLQSLRSGGVKCHVVKFPIKADDTA